MSLADILGSSWWWSQVNLLGSGRCLPLADSSWIQPTLVSVVVFADMALLSTLIIVGDGCCSGALILSDLTVTNF